MASLSREVNINFSNVSKQTSGFAPDYLTCTELKVVQSKQGIPDISVCLANCRHQIHLVSSNMSDKVKQIVNKCVYFINLRTQASISTNS